MGGWLIAAAILIASTGAGIAVLYQAGYEKDAANSTREYARYANQNIAEACGGVATELAHCFSKARIEAELQKRDHQRGQADLVAQRTTALWTTIMGVAAVFGVALSVAGVWLVYTTYRTGVETAERELRPYLLFDEAKTERAYEAGGHGIWRFTFTMTNHGQLPARIILADIAKEYVPWKQFERAFPKIALSAAKNPSDIVINKGGTHSLSVDASENWIVDPGSPHGVRGLVAVLAFVKYRGLTDTDKVAYSTKRGRIFGFVHTPDNGYGGPVTVCHGPDLLPDRRVDEVQ